MAPNPAQISIVMAEDDPDDQLLCREALAEARLANRLDFVPDGQALLDYLHHRGDYSGAPRPGLILLDLNMPRMDGREALRRIKADPDLRPIPVVVMTTSQAEQDVVHSYDLGANSYITKPIGFDSLVAIMGTLGRYWFEIVHLPGEGE